MYSCNIKTSQHDWVKINLITKSGYKGHYDIVECSNCKMKGKRINFENIEVAETYKKENIFLCPKRKPIAIPKKVKVTFCNALGNIFGNLTPNSIHEVIEPPFAYKNDHTGVWVMGVGEKVKLLTSEFVSVSF